MQKSGNNRRSIRIKGYDYSTPGAYFISTCVQGRGCLFGEVQHGEMHTGELGNIVVDSWHDLPNHYPNVALDSFSVMPNHFHGIIVLIDNVGVGFKPTPTNHGLPEIVRAFKTFSARRINEVRNGQGTRLWQRNYYEHVVRNEKELHRIRQYITDNPKQWERDRDNPGRKCRKRIKTADFPWGPKVPTNPRTL